MALLLCSGSPGCRGCTKDLREGDALLADATVAPSLEPVDRPPPEAFLTDALWNRAMQSEDDMDLASLADREGASGLLEAIEVGGKVGHTALAALPLADDAPVAYRRLAQLALLTEGTARWRVLQTIHDVAARPPRLREPVDEGGADVCAQALLRIARDPHAPGNHRAVAISSLRLPTFAHHVDAAQVPSDLDAPASSVSSAGP